MAFDNVSFSYPSRPVELALNKINLHIKQGEVIALVGPSGAGKTTLFELLQRFYDPQQGQIRFKGAELKQIMPNELRSYIALSLTW